MAAIRTMYLSRQPATGQRNPAAFRNNALVAPVGEAWKETPA